MASATLSPAPPLPQTPTPKGLSPRRLTFAQYMEWERKSDVKHHFYFGELIEVAGATYEHNTINANFVSLLNAALEETICHAVASDMKVFISPDAIYYPDTVVLCGDPLINPEEALQNPVLVAEVLSSSTEGFDRGQKFQQFRRIESLQHILFLQQNRPIIEHYEKNADGIWIMRGEYEELTQNLTLTISGTLVVLPLSKIYRFVTFPKTEMKDAVNAPSKE